MMARTGSNNVGIFAITVLLAACGGGGGGNGGSTGSGGNTAGTSGSQGILSVDRRSVTITSSLSDALTADQHLSVTLSNPPPDVTLYLVANYTANAVWAVDIPSTANGWSGPPDINLRMRAQSGLKPGTYSDTLRVRLCDSHSCSGRVYDTLPDIPITYTVTDYRQPPVISFDRSSITLQGLAMDILPPTSAHVHVTVQNLAYYPYIVASPTHSIVTVVNSTRKDDSSGDLAVNFDSPSKVGLGNTTDHISVVACLDSSCVNQLPASPFNIDVAETVAPMLTVAGPNGYTLSAMELSSYSIAADPVHRLVYATDENSGSTTRPTAEVIDPVTATVGITSPVLTPWPGRVSAVSDDGQFLYVAMTDDTVARFALPALTLDARFSPHADGEERTDATDIVPKPGASTTIAVAFAGASSTRVEPSAAIFDGSVQRPQFPTAGFPYSFSGTPIQGVAWDPNNPAVLYGAGVSALDTWTALSFTANTSGVSAASTLATWPKAYPYGSSRLRLANQSLYHDSGEIMDLQQGTSRLLTTDAKILFVIPDVAHNKLFVIGEDENTAGGWPTITMIHALNLQTMAPISDVALPGIVSTVQDVQRYGDDGIVFRMQGQLVFMSGAFVTN